VEAMEPKMRPKLRTIDQCPELFEGRCYLNKTKRPKSLPLLTCSSPQPTPDSTALIV
jgi:hypothetical protein